MNITKRRIRFELAGGQWTYWLSASEAKRYRAENIKNVVIEETMSYADAMRYLNPRMIAPALDKAIADELASKPGSIMVTHES